MNFLWALIAVLAFAGSITAFIYVLTGEKVWDAD